MNQNLSARYLEIDTDDLITWKTKWKIKMILEKFQTIIYSYKETIKRIY